MVTQTQTSELERFFGDFLKVSQAWNGLGEPMTVNRAIRLLTPITYQQSNFTLQQRAHKLLFHIVYGREPKSRRAS